MMEGEERTVLYERGEMLNQIEALQQEIEQLQAQAARMREALEYYADIKRWSEVNLIYVPSPDKARKALSATPTDYHNPADVEALRKAREALYAARVDVLTKETDELARDAVEAIDALIGGKEDV
jgi:phage shock protein A